MKQILFIALFLFGLVSLHAQQPTTRGVTPEATETSSNATGATWAVIVGISDYQNPDITDLQYADRDAMAFARYLRSAAGGHVDSSHITLLLNAQATAGQVAAAMDWLIDVTQEGDQVFIYYSGHGDVERKTISQPGFLLCWDAPSRVYMGGGTFALGFLQEITSTLSLQTKAKVTIITDACRAGKLAGSEIGGAQATAANLARQYANEVKIMSCQPEEFSLEGPAWGGGRGLFSYYFLQGIEGLADKNSDGKVSLMEIERYLDDIVPAKAAPHSQIPMTVGSKSAEIARVDPTVLAALRENPDMSDLSGDLLASNDKGVLDALSKDPKAMEQYNNFKTALKEGRLLQSENGSSAWDLFQELKDKFVMAPFQGLMRRNLAAALQDDAQQAINDYLKADPVELRNRWSYDNRYEKFPEYLGKAADLLGADHYLYKTLKAREHYFKGLNYRLRGERTKTPALYNLAVSEQQECLKLDPDAAYAYNELGLLDRRARDYKSAITHFEQAIAQSPGWVLPWANLCGTYINIGDFANAEFAGNHAIRLDSTFAMAQYHLGLAYRQLSEYTQAKIHYYSAIRHDPQYANAYYELGLLFYKEENYAKAEEMWTIFNTQKPNDYNVLGNLGLVCAKLGKKEKALDYFQQALKANPYKASNYELLGEFYLDEGKYSEAESAFWRSTELEPKSPYAYYLLACTMAMQNNLERASEHLEKAFANGYDDIKEIQEDPRLANLRQDTRFAALMDRYLPGWKK